jgi:hypothetical protein
MGDVIIIDGVNVAECKYYDDDICCNDDETSLSCENNICMFKQLKNAEKERNILYNEYHKAFAAKLKYFTDIEVLKRQLEVQTDEKVMVKAKMYDYQRALEEIKDTLNKIFNVCDDDCGNASEIAKVANRIDEVLNG